jgi:hypothetical protein
VEQEQAKTRGVVISLQDTINSLQNAIHNAPSTLYGLAPTAALAGLGYLSGKQGLKNLQTALDHSCWVHAVAGSIFLGAGLTAILKANAIVTYFK